MGLTDHSYREECVEHLEVTDVLDRLMAMEQHVHQLRTWILAHAPSNAATTDSPQEVRASERPRTAPPAPPEHWWVTCFNRLEIRSGNRIIPPCRSRRGQAILAFLLTSPGFSARADLLKETFWPEIDSTPATHNLQMAIHSLRRTLSGCGPGGNDDVVRFIGDHYQLNPALQIEQDVEQFRRAFARGQQAIAAGLMAEARHVFEEGRSHYTGPFLAGMIHDDWIQGQRSALEDLYLRILIHLSQSYDSDQQWERSAECCRDILRVDPYQEEAYRQLMRCQFAQGRIAEIHRTHQKCCAVLDQDLQVAPAPETTALYRQLTGVHPWRESLSGE